MVYFFQLLVKKKLPGGRILRPRFPPAGGNFLPWYKLFPIGRSRHNLLCLLFLSLEVCPVLWLLDSSYIVCVSGSYLLFLRVVWNCHYGGKRQDWMAKAQDGLVRFLQGGTHLVLLNFSVFIFKIIKFILCFL